MFSNFGGNEMKKITLLGLLVFLILFSYGCEKLPEFMRFGKPALPKKAKRPVVVEGTVLATIGDRVITLEEFNEKLEALPEQFRKQYQESPEGKRQFLDYLINRELLIKEALSRRLDNDEEVARVMAAFKEQILFEKLQQVEMNKIKITPQEIEEYYNMYKQAFAEPEERKIRIIVLKTDEEAKAILIELLKGADFSQMARQKSVEASAKDGGMIGFIARKTPFTPPEKKTVSQQVEETAFSLSLGDVSNVVKGPEGYYLIKVEEIKPAKERSLSEVSEDIKQVLLSAAYSQNLEVLLERLREETKPEIREWLLK
jgi:peptidyl-prolyl cis-trans isomerase C